MQLRHQIVQLVNEQQAQLAALMPLYVRAYNFDPSPLSEIFAQAYELYIDEGVVNNVPPLGRNDMSFKKAYDMFDGHIVELVKVDFSKIEGNQPLLMEYIRKKVLELELLGEPRRAKTFGGFLTSSRRPGTFFNSCCPSASVA